MKMKKAKTVKTGVSFPSDLLAGFDRVLKDIGISSRSRGLQEAIRTFISVNFWKLREEENVAGVILIHYSHDIKGLEEELTDIQHRFIGVIASTLHLHLTEEDCLQIIAVSGVASKIKELIRVIRSVRRLKQLLPVLVTIK
ncbi:MAG: hypothetical protein ABDH32_06940 [Candidatus Caldarchaeales archaeon]